MNELLRRLGNGPALKCLQTSTSAEVASGVLPLAAKGVANLDGRKDWETCPKASFLLSLCVHLAWVGSWVDVIWVYNTPQVVP